MRQIAGRAALESGGEGLTQRIVRAIASKAAALRRGACAGVLWEAEAAPLRLDLSA